MQKTSKLGEICNKPVDEKALVRGLRVDGLATVIGGLFNSFPHSQNIGLGGVTGARRRWVCVAAGAILVLFGRTLDDTSQQPSLIKMYSLVGRIRMISSEVVLTSAEKVAEDIVESYKRPPMSFQEFQQSWEASNPWHEFTKAYRAERQSMLGRLWFFP